MAVATSLSQRMKEYYEDRTKTYLMRNQITILRLDGKGFSKYSKSLNKPFDDGFSDDMDMTAMYLCENIQGAKFAYTQSDEISLVLTDFDTHETDAWFDYNVQKMVSISAALATAKFNQLRNLRFLEEFLDSLKDLTDVNQEFNDTNKHNSLPIFDSRVFQVPNVEEMINCMIWRQQDCTRNSISMAASAHYSHKELEGKSGNEKQEMLFQKGINWNDYKSKYKRGSVIKKIESDKTTGYSDGSIIKHMKWEIDQNTPIFTEDRDYIKTLIPNI